ncbi:MAG: hypothetical protein HQL48_05990, partial [Gammaproteobacteria bacterium]|nr:hypothetical protein [Gammaproteobacteria bacterium]
ITVSYATSDGSTSDGSAAEAGSDYSESSGMLEIPAGETTGVITVLVNGDTDVEPDEEMTLTLFEPVGAKLIYNGSMVIGNIINDDTLFRTLTMPKVADLETEEGNSGTTNLNLEFEISKASTEDIFIKYTTLAKAQGSLGKDELTDVADSDDYVSVTSTDEPLVFPAGSKKATLTIKINGDLDYEADERFYLVIYALNQETDGVQLDANELLEITIINDDPIPEE